MVVTYYATIIRPLFHFTPRRIEALVCICFIAYKVYKELEKDYETDEVPHECRQGS